MSTAEASPRRSLPNLTFDCDQQSYPYQPTVSFSDGDGIKHAVSTNPEHETQSLLISNNATLCENDTSSFLNPAGTAAINTPVCCYFSVHHPSSSIQHIPVNNFNNDSRVVGNMPAISNQYSGYTPHDIVSQPPANLFPLSEWKLAQYDGNPLQWHEFFGQFCSTVDAASLSDDVKLTYLKTLVTGKAKSAIAEFAYSGRMYKDALKTLERKFGQPQNKT